MDFTPPACNNSSKHLRSTAGSLASTLFVARNDVPVSSPLFHSNKESTTASTTTMKQEQALSSAFVLRLDQQLRSQRESKEAQSAMSPSLIDMTNAMWMPDDMSCCSQYKDESSINVPMRNLPMRPSNLPNHGATQRHECCPVCAKRSMETPTRNSRSSSKECSCDQMMRTPTQIEWTFTVTPLRNFQERQQQAEQLQQRYREIIHSPPVDRRFNSPILNHENSVPSDRHQHIMLDLSSMECETKEDEEKPVFPRIQLQPKKKQQQQQRFVHLQGKNISSTSPCSPPSMKENTFIVPKTMASRPIHRPMYRSISVPLLSPMRSFDLGEVRMDVMPFLLMTTPKK